MKNKQVNWEKEFDEIWYTQSGYQNENLPMAYDPIKKLISQVEKQAYAAGRNTIIELIKHSKITNLKTNYNTFIDMLLKEIDEEK